MFEAIYLFYAAAVTFEAIYDVALCEGRWGYDFEG